MLRPLLRLALVYRFALVLGGSHRTSGRVHPRFESAFMDIERTVGAKLFEFYAQWRPPPSLEETSALVEFQDDKEGAQASSLEQQRA